MKNKRKSHEKTKATPEKLIPELRFPEFRDTTEREIKSLGDVAKLIDKRAGTKKYILMSVNSGIGLIPQIEKFGKEIAGKQYKNYYVIKKGDFAYNKSATKEFPEGYISMLVDQNEAALPNSIFICFRIVDKNTYPDYLNHLFHANFHGVWLRKFISVGARAHGALNVDPDNFLSMPIKFPSFDEQKKIADCLSSLDELISAHNQKLEHLQTYKKGLMQQLFPAEGETMPRLRFPEFRNAPKWQEKPLNLIAVPITRKNKKGDITNVLTLSSDNGIMLQSEYFGKKIAGNNTNKYIVIEENDFVYNDRTTKLFTYGTIKRLSRHQNGIVSPIYKCFRFHKNQIPIFWEYYFESGFHENQLHDLVNEGARKGRFNISSTKFLTISIWQPSPNEQQKIADCISSLDEHITAQVQNIVILKEHKKGLTQKLFPSAIEVNK